MSSTPATKSTSRDLTTPELLRSPVTALNGVSENASGALSRINIRSIHDLATSPVFRDAARLAFPTGIEAALRHSELLPMELLDAERRIDGDPAHYPVVDLHEVDEDIQTLLVAALGIETVRDLALWPPYLAARKIAGFEITSADPIEDPEIPTELVPKLNEHATEKVFYSIYTVDPTTKLTRKEVPEAVPATEGESPTEAVPATKGQSPTASRGSRSATRGEGRTALRESGSPTEGESRTGLRESGSSIEGESRTTYREQVLKIRSEPETETELEGAVDLAALARASTRSRVRTGSILRYEQSWTPIALTLGNLLHSLALAPGESTRVAIVDWTRRQGVSTTESASQMESLANSMVQNRSINEVTRAVAREAQTGFSNMNANSTVSNSAYTAYGLQNAGEALSAGLAGVALGGAGGAAAGGVAGAGIGGVAGVVVGGVAGSSAGGVGAIPGMIIGGAIGVAAGGAIGAGSGAVIGGAAGGVAGFMGAAEFGSNLDSGSGTMLESVTTTASTGERELESEMLQTVSDRTQQHSSSARNRRASIVQEVHQSETEKVSTRVVTNYNHMHALTVQYFEVVQLYAARTTLVRKQPCLFVPIEPIQRWTPDLVRLFRAQILASALSADVAYSLLTTAGTVAIHSPTFARVSAKFRNRMADAHRLLDQARNELDAIVSTNPFNDWRLPESMYLSYVRGSGFTHGTSPFVASSKLSFQLIIHLHTGARHVVDSEDASGPKISLREIASIDYVITAESGSDVDLAARLEDPQDENLALFFCSPDIDPDPNTGFYGEVGVPVLFQVNASMVDNNTVTVPLVNFSAALSMSSLVRHLNENTEYYSRQVIRRPGNPLLPKLLTHFTYGGEVLANIVDPDPVAINGDSLVFLLHDAQLTAAAGAVVGSVRSEEIVPIGTGGVFAEAVQGRANASERLDITRFWDWKDSPIPIVAPEIAPVSMGSRAMATDVRPGSLDPNVLTPMAPRGLPTPVGTSAVLSALQKDLFRDMSGIGETAQLAQTALQEAMKGAVESGGQVSENLQKGMEHTTEIMGKVLDMTDEYGTMLADTGFGLMTDAASTAMSGGLGGGAGVGAGGGAGGSSGGGLGAIASGVLGNRNSSIAGALLNKAAKVSEKKGSPGAGAGSNGGITGGANGLGAAVEESPRTEQSGWVVPLSLEESLLRGMGGLPRTTSRGSGTPGDDEDAELLVDFDIPELIQTKLLPLLANASESDEEFFRATQAALDLIADVELRGQDAQPLWTAALPKLAPAWKAAVDRAVADFNGGDLGAADRISELLAAGGGWEELMGATTQGDVLGLLDVSVQISDIEAPAEVVGGEEVTITARVIQTLPDGSTGAAPGAQASLVGWPIQEETVAATADADGVISFTFNHGVPPENFSGIHRFTGYLDLEVYISALSSFSSLFSDQAKVVVPGKIEVTLESAISDHDGSDVLVGSIVHAHVGRLVILEFRAMKAGQAVQAHSMSTMDVSLNGEGLIDGVTSTDAEGRFVVEYLAPQGASGIAYLSPLVKLSAESEQAGMAQISIITP